MKKILRLAKAEFNKIFYRPSIFILTALLVGTLVLTSLLYSPNVKSTKLSYEAKTVGEIYEQFIEINKNTLNKYVIDNNLENQFLQIQSQYEDIKQNKLETLTDKTVALKKYFPNEQDGAKGLIQDEVLKISTYTDKEFLINKQDTIDVFENLKSEISGLTSYLAQIQNQTLNFYFYESDFDLMYNSLTKLYNALPSANSLNNQYDRVAFINLGNTISSKYNINLELKIVSKLKSFSINEEDYNEIIETYYNQAKQKLQNTYFAKIEQFNNQKSLSVEQNDKDIINEYIANYQSFAQMNQTVMSNKFMLLRIKDVKDTQIEGLIGYSQVYKYKLNEEIKINEYLIKNEIFDYNYLSSFNFNSSSSYTTNSYDYTVYTMQILIILIIIFTIFYACSSIAGDQYAGTMKMIAIRPYTRDKLFAGKYISCLMFGVMLILISMICSFVVGAISYGVTFKNCLVVFNSSTVISISPILLLFLYLFSLILNLLFYISLAMLLCLVFKSNALSVFVSSVFYGAQIILCGTVSSAWLNYTPFGHFDLFKFFGNSQFGLLKMNILPDANFLTSAIVLCSLIVIFNIISHFIFKRRDIA